MIARGVLALALTLSLLGLLMLGMLIAQDTIPEPAEDAPPQVAAVRPHPAPLVRQPLRPPPGITPPEPAAERPSPAQLEPADRKLMNYAVDNVLKEARDDCILPWIDAIEDPLTAEFVFDAVLHDGQLFDVGLRSLSAEVPPTVLDCVAEKAWLGDWPTWNIQGELRLQRSTSYQNQAEQSAQAP